VQDEIEIETAIDAARLFAAGPEAMLVLRADRVACANERALELAGRELAELDVREAIPDWREGLDDTLTFEATLVRGDGSELPVEIRARRLGVELVVVSLRDARDLIEGREARSALAEAS